MAVQGRENDQRDAARGRIQPFQSTQRRLRVARVQSVGQVPGGHSPGGTEERLELL